MHSDNSPRFYIVQVGYYKNNTTNKQYKEAHLNFILVIPIRQKTGSAAQLFWFVKKNENAHTSSYQAHQIR